MRHIRSILALCLTGALSAAEAAPFAYLPTPDGVTVIDLASHSEAAFLPKAGTRSTWPSADKRYVYAAATDGARLIDTRTQSVVATFPIPELSYFVPDPVLPRAYIPGKMTDFLPPPDSGTVQVLDTESLKVVTTLQLGGIVNMIFDSTGTRAYFPEVGKDAVKIVDTATSQITSSLPVETPLAIALHPSGKKLYVINEKTKGAFPGHSITVLDVEKGTLLATIQIGPSLGRLVLNPSGSRLFVTSNYDNTVSVIDTANNTLITTIPVTGAGAIDVHPNGDEVYVMSRDAQSFKSTLTVISTETLAVTATIFLREGAGSAVHFVAGDAPPGAVSGLWGNTSEPGWGVQLTQRRNTIFGAWYTYDAAGASHWYVASACKMTSQLACPACVANTSCTGPLYEVDGARFLGTGFNSAAVKPHEVGSLRIDFRDRDNATLSYTLADKSRAVPIARNVFKPPLPAASVDYTDLWWNSGEPGWGLGITHQSGTLFLSWFIYDSAGRASWLFASDCAVNAAANGCTGTVYRTSGSPGPIMSGAFNPSAVNVRPVGTVGVTFGGYDAGMLTYTVDGVSGAKAIVRNLF